MATTKEPVHEVFPKKQEQYDDVLRRAYEGAIAYLANLDAKPVAPTADLETLRGRFLRPLDEKGTAPEQVITELVRDAEGGILGSTGGRFYGWVMGGTVPAALAADWLTSVWDQNAGVYATAPAAAVVEEVAGAWLKELLGLPPSASFALVSGCQMAHVTCLAAARHAVLARRGWDLDQQGLSGSPAIRVLVSEQRHATVARALRLLGIGRAQVVSLATDGMSRVEGTILEDELKRNSGSPVVVVLQAGDINTGACDRFETLIPMAKEHGAWVHVDGAFGLWAAASGKYRDEVRGVEGADSWATDGHKWLNVPYDCGYAFVADAEAHRTAMTYRSAYVSYDGEARDEMEWNPEWSRRARGFATYAALRQMGREGVSALVERCCAHARSLGTRMGKLAGAELMCEPMLNQAMVRFVDTRPGAEEADHAERTDAVIAAINATGEAYFTGSTWKGKRVMRISVCNWRTSKEDVERTVRAVAAVLQHQAIGNRG